MNREKQFDDNLREALQTVQSKTLEDRDTNKSVNVVQGRLDKFLVDWCPRIAEELEARQQRNRDESERAQPEIGTGASISQERDRAADIMDAIKQRDLDIKGRISELRDGMFQAVIDIQKGREPDLRFTDRAQEPIAQAENSGPLFGVDLSVQRKALMESAAARKLALADRQPETDVGMEMD